MNISLKPMFRPTVCFFLCFTLAYVQQGISQCSNSALEIPQNGIDEDCDGLDDFYLNLPPQIYLVQGQAFKLHFYNTILSTHAWDYRFEVVTPLTGTTNAKSWSLTPSAQQVGLYPFTLRVLTASGQVLGVATSQLVISKSIDPNIPNGGKLLLLGHSFLDQGYLPYYLYNLTHQAGVPAPSFHGSKPCWANANALMEGHGGKTWRWFAQDSFSPFFSQRPINIPAYFNQYFGSNSRPEYVVTYLDVNDFLNYTDLNTTTLQAIDDTIQFHWNQYAQPIIDSIRMHAPNAKIAFCTVPPSAGWDEPFDSLGLTIPRLADRWRWQKVVSRLHIKLNARYANRTQEGIYIIPTHLNFDGLTDYQNNDPVHPRPGNLLPNQSFGGYNLLAESIFAWIRSVQSNSLQLFTFYQDADEDGYGNPNQTLLAASVPSGYVINDNDCNDQNAAIHPGATEICGNQIDENCNGTLNEDITAPIAQCITTKPVFSLPATGQYVINPALLNQGSTDNCSSVMFASIPSQLSCSSLGWKTVILRVEDQNGNFDTCHTVVFLQDELAPTITCTNQTIALDQSGNAHFLLRECIASLTDNCAIDSSKITNEIVHFSCNDAGSMREYTIEGFDFSGNIGTCTVRFSVIDTFPPVINCTNQMVMVGASGTIALPLRNAITWIGDNCPIDSASISNDTILYSCQDVDRTIAYTLTVSDQTGNASSCAFEVMILALDTDQDGSNDCNDFCPNDPNTTTGYTWFIDLDGDGFGAGPAGTGCIPATNGVSSNTDCDDNNSTINPAALEIPDNAIDENCDGVVDSTSFVHQVSPSNFALYPNPASQNLFLRAEKTISQVVCLHASGQEIFNLAQLHLNTLRLDVATLPPAMYLLIVSYTDGSQVKRSWVKVE